MNQMAPSKDLIANWQSHHASLFGEQPLMLEHRLAESGLFTREAIGRLIERCPRDHYGLVSMGRDRTRAEKIYGEIGQCEGVGVIEAIEKGRMWLNIRRVMDFAPEYKDLLDKIFSEFESRMPGLETFKRNIGVLVSSPNAQVFYHADIQGQSLWQIEGRKRVYLYPNARPFLAPESVEKILLRETDEDVQYQSWFDDYADVHELQPGQMLTWPLYWPHRVENLDCLNISVTMEHWTRDIWKSYAVHYGNGVLRRTLGARRLSVDTSGLGVYAKALSAFGWKKMGRETKGDVVKGVHFDVDPVSPDGMRMREALAA